MQKSHPFLTVLFLLVISNSTLIKTTSSVQQPIEPSSSSPNQQEKEFWHTFQFIYFGPTQTIINDTPFQSTNVFPETPQTSQIDANQNFVISSVISQNQPSSPSPSSSQTNTVNGVENKIDGYENKVNGDYNGINGNYNGLIGNYNKIDGSLNGINGNSNQIQGNSNGVTGTGNLVIGNRNNIVS